VVDHGAHDLQRREDLPPHLVGRAHRVDRDEDAALAVPVDDRVGHLVVEREAALDDLFGVVGAVLALGPVEQPADQLVVVGLEVQRDVGGQVQVAAELVQGAGLGHAARDAVEHVPGAGRSHLEHRLAHHLQDHVVGYQVAVVEVALDLAAHLGLPGDVVAQQVAGTDVRDGEVRRDQRTLRTFARPGRRHHQYPHRTSLASPEVRPTRGPATVPPAAAPPGRPGACTGRRSRTAR
jgi:hypothetical protein